MRTRERCAELPRQWENGNLMSLLYSALFYSFADMTKTQRSLLIHFMLGTPIYTGGVDSQSIICFVQGFTIGARCDFLEIFRAELEAKYKIPWPSNGLIGQIETLSKRELKAGNVLSEPQRLSC